MNSTLTTIVSSSVALIGVALGVWLGARSTSNQWLKDAQLKACQRLMDEYAPLYDTLALSRRREIRDQNWAVWNQALTAVTFVAVKPVVDAACALDEQLWRADWAIRGGETGQTAWLKVRRPVDEARDLVIREVRRQTNRSFRQQVRSTGRPTDEDPMWNARGGASASGPTTPGP